MPGCGWPGLISGHLLYVQRESSTHLLQREGLATAQTRLGQILALSQMTINTSRRRVPKPAGISRGSRLSMRWRLVVIADDTKRASSLSRVQTYKNYPTTIHSGTSYEPKLKLDPFSTFSYSPTFLKSTTYNHRRMKSAIPLFVTSGNKLDMRLRVTSSSSPDDAQHETFRQIECDSQSWTRRRSSSNHPLYWASPTPWAECSV
jgi:hypothetical protein